MPWRIVTLVLSLMLFTFYCMPVSAQDIILEAETFTSTGGSYNDAYVPYGVDTSIYGIHFVNRGDWVDYTLNITQAGGYQIDYLISTPLDGVQIQSLIDGSIISTDDVPNNGAWDVYTSLTASSTVELAAGSYTFRLNATGTHDWQWNLDDIRFTRVRIPVEGVSLLETSLNLIAGESYDLNATVSPADASDPFLSWVSWNNGVASVDANGRVTALAEGTSTLVVRTTDGGYEAQCQVNVFSTNQSAYPDGIPHTIPGDIASVHFDMGANGVAYYDDSPGNNGGGLRSDTDVDTEYRIPEGNVGWIAAGEWLEYTINVQNSGNYDIDVPVATIYDNGAFHIEFDDVDKTGLQAITSTGAWYTFNTITITDVALDAGTQVMRIYFDGGNLNLGTISIQSSEIPVSGVSLSHFDLHLDRGETFTLTETVSPADATDPSVSWESGNTSIATVDAAGRVTAVGAGTTELTVRTTDGGYMDATIIYVDVPVTGVSLPISSLDLNLGQTYDLNESIEPADAVNSAVSWHSDNTGAVTVDENGLIHAQGGGDAIITVTTDDGGFEAQCNVSVQVPVTGVSLSASSLELLPGQTYDLDEIITPNDASDPSVSWHSDNTDVLTIDENGFVQAVAEGEALVTITTNDGGLKAYCSVLVRIPVHGVSLSEELLSLSMGDSFDLIATVTPEGASDTAVTWTTNNPFVAMVDPSGRVTAMGTGVAIIEVTTRDGAYTDQCVIRVDVSVSGVTISDTALTLHVGQTYGLDAVITPEHASDQQVVWTSSNNAVALVNSEGLIGALGEGQTVITVTTADGGYTATCTVQVVIPVFGVEISHAYLELVKGDVFYLNAAIDPPNATEPSVSWHSDNPQVASVDTSGRVEAVGGGATLITVRSADGGYTESCLVIVDVPVTGVNLSVDQISIYPGQSYRLEADILPEDASNNVIYWSSSDSEIARVDEYGLVTALNDGEVIITVTTADGGYMDSCEFIITPLPQQMAYPAGVAHPVPGRIEAIHFDLGLNGEAYYDSDSGNNGDGPRGDTDMDTEYGLPVGNIAWLVAGEWLEYTVNVLEAGSYDIDILVSSVFGYGAMHLEMDGAPVTESMEIDFQNTAFDTITLIDVELASGIQVFRVFINEGGFRLGTMVFYRNYIPVAGISLSDAVVSLEVGDSYALGARVLPEDATNTSLLWISSNPESVQVDSAGLLQALAIGSSMITVSSTDGWQTANCLVNVTHEHVQLVIEAEDYFSTGGAYNGFATYSVDDVTAIKDNQTGDWADYSVNIPVGGSYLVEYHIGTTVSGSAVEFVLNDTSIMLDEVSPGTNWDAFIPMAASQEVNLYKGIHTIRLKGAGTNGWEWNMDKFILSRTGSLGEEEPNSLERIEISLFPNPATDVLSIRFSQKVTYKAQLTLYNSTGNSMLIKGLSDFSEELDISAIPPGIYFVRVENGGSVSHGRFVKQ